MSLQYIAVVCDTDSALDGLITALTLQDRLAGFDCNLKVFIEQGSRPINENAVYIIEPDFIHVLNSLGISEQALITHCDGSIHLGEMHKSLHIDSGKIKQKFNSRAPLGTSISGVEFHHLLVQCQQTEQAFDKSLLSYSLVGQLYAQGRFIPPSQDKRSIASSIEYAIAVDAMKLQEQLGFLCDKLHIDRHTRAELRLIKQSEVTPTYSEQALGKVNCIALGSEDEIAHFPVDFLFDARANAPDLQHNTLCQLTWTGALEKDIDKAHGSGCQHTLIRLSQGIAQFIKLNNQLTIELTLFNSEQATIDASLTELKAHVANTFSLDIESIEWQSTEKTQNKLCEQLWTTNTVSLARIVPSLDYLPMRRTSLCDMIDLWLQFYPAKFEQASETYPILSATFNQLAMKYQQNLHDFEHFLLFPIAASEQSGEGEYSKRCSQSLLARIHLFENTGTDYLSEQDCIAPYAWRNLALALSYWPKNYDPVTNNIPNVPGIVSNMAKQIEAAAKQAPSIRQFLNSVAKAS